MKPLFIDLLTKCVPDHIDTEHMSYKIPINEKESYWVDISWMDVDDDTKVEMTLSLPFTSNPIWKYPRTEGIPKKRVYIMRINSVAYPIELNAIETNEVDHLIYQIFQQYQINLLGSIKNWIKSQTEPQTTEQKFEAAQEKVAEDNGD